MKILLRIIKILAAILLMLTLVVTIVFVRFDISRERLDAKYFTDYSHDVTLSILTLEGQTIDIDIHYQDFGSINDPVVVLLHGAFASSHTFTPWAEMLVLEGYRVLAIDLPYHGLSGGFMDQVTSQRRSAAVVKTLLDQLEIDSIIIGGNSMGGGVSWYFTSEYHGVDGFEVKGLVLISAVYPGMQGGGGPARMQRILASRIITGVVSKMTPRFILNAILDGVYGSGSTLEEETVTRYYELLRRSGNRQAILRNTREEDLGISGEERLLLIRDAGIPVLVMWGLEDTWVPVELAYAFEETLMLEETDLIIYEDIGHVPMEEQPARTLIDLLVFINQIA